VQSISTQPQPIHLNKNLVLFCTISVFLYALTKFWIGGKISAYFEAAFLLPFYYVVFKNWKHFIKSKFTWMCIGMLAVPTLQFLTQYMQNPELAIKYQGIDKLFKLTFFIAAGFWLSQNLKLVPWFVAANLMGFFILLSLQENALDSILTMHTRYRHIFKGIHHEFMSTYSGVALIASIYLFKPSQNISPKYLRYGVFSLLAASIALCLLFIAFSQTRAIILGLIAATAFLLFFHRKNKVIFTLSILSLTTIILLTFTSNIGARFNQEATAFLEYMYGERSIPKDNTGYRLLSWKIGAGYILEYPLTGMGGGANKDSMVNSPQADGYMKKDLHHYHNSIIEFGLAYGIFGAAIIAASIFIYFYYTSSNIPPALLLYGSTQIIFLYFINLFESYFFYWQGVHLLIWALSPVAAFIIAKRLRLSVS